MGKGGGDSDSTSTVYTRADPWEGVQQYLKALYSNVSSLPMAEAYPWQTYANMDPLTEQGIASNLGYVNNEFPNVYSAGTYGLSNLLGAMDVGNNPYVQDMNQALAQQTSASGQQQIGQGAMQLARALQNNTSAYDDMLASSQKSFINSILPAITQEANSVGGLGGSRQALAQIGAVDEWGNDLAKAMRDITQSTGQGYQDYAWGLGNMVGENQRALASGIAQQNLGAYGTGVNAVGTAMGYLPQQVQLGMIPGQTYQQAGNIFEGYQQKAIDDAIAKWDFMQNAPWQYASNMNAIFQGATPYASSSSRSTEPNYSSPWANVAAAGLGAYGLFS